MRPSSQLYSTEHPHLYHQQQQQQQQQPAHQMQRSNPPSSGHVNFTALGVEALGTRPRSAGAPSGLIDLSCSGPRLQHHYRPPASASDVGGKFYPERGGGGGGRCQTLIGGSRVDGPHRDGVSSLRLEIPSSPTPGSALTTLCNSQ